MTVLTGLATARGVAAGPVFIYRGDGEFPIPEYLVEPGREGDELMRLKRARAETRRDLESLIAVLRQRSGNAEAKVFECHLMILEDQTLVDETERHITENRLNAEAAVRKTSNGARALFARMNDPYFRERVRDLDDVERRLLKMLVGFSANPARGLKRPSVIVADDLTPSETVQLPRELVLGFATNGGSTTSHVALLARAMGLPAVTGLSDVTARVTAGETILIDGSAGTVTLSPDDATRRQFAVTVARQRLFSAEAAAGAPAGTLADGGGVLIYANLHPGVPLEGVRELGARGVGLYRSEYLWLSGEGEPSEPEQFVAYRDAVTFAMTLSETATITIRTLDIGGDKLVRGISQIDDARPREPNPFLGNRSIRYLLSHPDVFRAQLRAILKASAYGRVRLMYPMVSCVEELKAAAEILEESKRQLTAEGFDFDAHIPVGAMVEVPAAALNAPALARHVDFFSIGTNDLVQYTMAADRGNDAVAHLYQPLNPAVIRLVDLTIAAAKARGISVSVCGESASDPVIGTLWAAMGVDTLSMSATYIPVMAQLFARLTRADLDAYRAQAAEAPQGSTGAEMYARCRDWLRARVGDFDSFN